MGIKIWWQDILPSADRSIVGGDVAAQKETEDKLLQSARQVAGEGTEIEVHHVKYSSYAFNASYLEMLNSVWIIDGIIEAEQKGYDAAVIGCGNDPGLQEARQAVDIPVVGPTEAAMLLACSLGSKFGVITVMDEFVPVCERNIRNYGLGVRVAGPVKVYQMGENPFKALFDMVENPASINPQFDSLCRQCIENGAEVIIPACASLSPATSLLGYKTVPDAGVPVIDITQAAVKLAENLVDLKRTIGLGKSQKGLYKSIPSKLRDRMRAAVNCVDTEQE
ncbi:MAG: aspartate/glutamate racemase family protein [Desulfobacterales bacterium]